MSWSDPIKPIKRVLVTGFALGALLITTGCVRPLYGNSAAGNTTRQELAAINVLPIPDVAGHYLREELLFSLTGGADLSVEPKYKLAVMLSDRTVSAAGDTTSGRADAAALQITAKFALTDLKGHVLTDGSAYATASIDRLAQRFAAVRAVQDAKIRVGKVIAEQIETRLAAWFASRS
jgi:LPS-assembly lipoprotein